MDTHLFQLRLPQDKLYSLRSEIRNWLRRRRCRKRDLQSLIGLLNHAASVIGPGHNFMRGLIDALHFASVPHHWLRLNHTARAHLHWGALLLSTGMVLASCQALPLTSMCFQMPQGAGGVEVSGKEVVPVAVAT